MAEPAQHPFKVAIVWRGDAATRAEARPQTSRLKAIFEALARRGVSAEPAVWAEELGAEVRAQLLRSSKLAPIRRRLWKA
jgi:hypothetical protein